MRRIASRFVAASSCVLLLCASLVAARRARYGGTLRIQTRAAIASADLAAVPPDSFDAAAKQRILGQVFETLVRLDDKGEPQPLLATAWTHDAGHKRWLFTPRPHVLLHNGQAWDPPGGVIAVDDRRSIDEILRSLSQPQNAIAVRTTDGAMVGTGPFRIAKWEAGTIALQAHDGYWGGRPYLDQVEIRMGRAPRDQSLDFDLGKVDVVELPVSEVRRVQQRGGRVALSSAVDVMVLVVETGAPGVERALALAIDRGAIHNVLLQRTGSISGGLLPNWLSGYSFLFSTGQDLARARELSVSRPALTFAYDQQTPLTRSIAERITLNAGEVGIALRPVAKGSADVRLVTLRLSSPDPAQALAEMAAGLQASVTMLSGEDVSQLYAAEREVIASRRVVPLLHLPAAYQLNQAVHGWPLRGASIDRWRLDEVWLDERGRP